MSQQCLSEKVHNSSKNVFIALSVCLSLLLCHLTGAGQLPHHERVQLGHEHLGAVLGHGHVVRVGKVLRDGRKYALFQAVVDADYEALDGGSGHQRERVGPVHGEDVSLRRTSISKSGHLPTYASMNDLEVTVSFFPRN